MEDEKNGTSPDNTAVYHEQQQVKIEMSSMSQTRDISDPFEDARDTDQHQRYQQQVQNHPNSPYR